MGKLSPLRRRMIEDMRVRNLSPATQEAYVRGRRPELVGAHGKHVLAY